MPSLNIHEFQIQLRVREIDEDLENAVFEAGCDDTSLWSSEGEVYLQFHREAYDLSSAVRSALADLEEAGIPIARIIAPLSLAEAG